MTPRLILAVAAISTMTLLSACQTQNAAQVVTPSAKGAVELRAIQGRVFDTADRGKTLRTVIATLQDLGYGIEKVEAGAGTVSARKLSALRLSVTVFPRGDKQMIVRANAVVDTSPSTAAQVDAPEFYQTLFFEPLSKALFLTANQDTGDAPPAPVAPAVSPPDAAKPKPDGAKAAGTKS
jgi:hypothetical protein